MRVWCKLIQKWLRDAPNNNKHLLLVVVVWRIPRYAISSDWKICHRTYVNINWPGDLDL